MSAEDLDTNMFGEESKEGKKFQIFSPNGIYLKKIDFKEINGFVQYVGFIKDKMYILITNEKNERKVRVYEY